MKLYEDFVTLQGSFGPHMDKEGTGNKLYYPIKKLDETTEACRTEQTSVTGIPTHILYYAHR